MMWTQLSLFSKVMAITTGSIAIVSVIFVFGYGRLWFRPKR